MRSQSIQLFAEPKRTAVGYQLVAANSKFTVLPDNMVHLQHVAYLLTIIINKANAKGTVFGLALPFL
ncbi:hypothetical protein V1358_00850 [Pseudoalteromonas sp. YIC-656]|uniref:hypothetical protein n=1 Tax=Pseudoalteromonas pernae TaxID=3118054 RepID=UPI0032421AB4